MARTYLCALIFAAVCAAPFTVRGQELTKEQVVELTRQPEDRSNLAEALKIFPSASEYDVTMVVKDAEGKQTPLKVVVREKVVQGKYIVATTRVPGFERDSVSLAFYDDGQACYRRYYIHGNGAMELYLGIRAGDARVLTWCSAMPNAANFSVTQEVLQDDKTIWREMMLLNGKVMTSITGEAIVTKRPGKA